MKLLLITLLLITPVFAQDKLSVTAPKEDSLEINNLWLSIQVKQQEARALKAEAAIAEQEVVKLNGQVRVTLDAIMDKLKLDKAKYTASIEGNKLVFVLKPIETTKP